MKNRQFVYSIIILVIISSCHNVNDSIKSVEKLSIFSNENLISQEYKIPADKDTVVTGESGTILSIEKNTFTDQKGNPITGKIKIELKECLTPLDIVLGNMTTTSNGRFLESGGMVYLNATSDNQQLLMAANKSISVEVPTDSLLDNMQLFEGELDSGGINWINPIPFNAVSEELNPNDSIQITVILDTIYKKHNVAYNVSGYEEKMDSIPEILREKIVKQLFSGNGMMLTKDSSILIDGYKVNLYKHEKIEEWSEFKYGKKWIERMNVNTYTEDRPISYIFSMKKLGWANIDRLYEDSRTKEIELIVTVDKYQDYKDIYISMIFKNQNMYIPGYQKKDKTFSFAHCDYEKPTLPIGETATILITAYNDKKVFYGLKTFIIKEKQNVDFTLSETTKEELKEELKLKI